MSNLSEVMQKRLDQWRTKAETVEVKGTSRPVSRRNGKNDYGDAETLEQWEEECKRSQTRK